MLIGGVLLYFVSLVWSLFLRTQPIPPKIEEVFCARLQTLGIRAVLTRPGGHEDQLIGPSLGVIFIEGGPIRWVAVRAPDTEGWCYADWGIPDPRLARSERSDLHIETERTSTWWGARPPALWRGSDGAQEIVATLNSLALRVSLWHASIRAHRAAGCWTLSVPFENAMPGSVSSTDWENYQALARCLLVAPVSEVEVSTGDATGLDAPASASY